MKFVGGGKGEGFDVMKFGDVRVVLIGFFLVGKLILLNKLIFIISVSVFYEFIILICIFGVIEYNGVNI